MALNKTPHYFVKNFRAQSKGVLKQILGTNSFVPFSLFLLLIGVVAGVLLVNSSTELREKAAVDPYTNCGGTCKMSCSSNETDTGLCSGSSSGPKCCVPSSASPTSIAQVPTSTPSCIANGQVAGPGSSCCSGHFYQSGNNVICGTQTGSTCLGSCVSSSQNSCGAIGRVTANGNCANGGELCCGGSVALSPTPTPSDGTGGVQMCSLYCLNTPSCDRLGRVSASGVCLNVSDVCCGEAKPGVTDAPSCISNSCVGGKWCGSDGKQTTINCTTGLKKCDNIINNTCYAFTPIPTPTSTPLCTSGSYRCQNGAEYYCIGGGSEASSSCGTRGCDSSGRRCAQPTPTPRSCTTQNGTVINRDLNTYCCNGVVTTGACDPDSLGIEGQSCQSTNNCQSFLGNSLICVGGICRQCHANTCVKGIWCGSDYKPTTISCSPGQTTCDHYETGICVTNTPIPTQTPLPTPTTVSGLNCRQNSDCGLGYLCLRDSGDNSYSCQPEKKTRFCWTYNFTTKNCESFSSYSGVSCPVGSSPNSDICVHPTPIPGIDQFQCVPGRKYCIGNNSVSCSNIGSTVVESCPNGCSPVNGICNSGSSCQLNSSWCSATQPNTLSQCAAPYALIQNQTCSYGCDFAANSCFSPPNSLTYAEVLEHQIEKEFNIAIDRSSATSEQAYYDTLMTLQETLPTLPQSMKNRVAAITIFKMEEDNRRAGYTYRNGFVGVAQCTSDIKTSCAHFLIHEIAHNTEELSVTSFYCPEGKQTCPAIEGFISAAEKDPHPIIFNPDGTPSSDSDINGLGSNSAEKDYEYFANYQAVYLDNAKSLYCAHPVIFEYFQDMYHPDNNTTYQCS